MTRVGICPECADKTPIYGRLKRQRLLPAPDGRRLCQRHHREAWGEEMEVSSE